MAVGVFAVLECEGMARVDFFLDRLIGLAIKQFKKEQKLRASF